MVSRIGMRRPLYCTGVGKAILATRGDEEVLRCWEESERVPCTPYTITRKDAFLREISQIRQHGYAMDNEENELGGAVRGGGHPGLARGGVLCPVHFGPGFPYDG